MKRIFITLLLLSIIRPALEGRIFEMSAFGIKPGATNLSEKISSAMESIRKETGHGDSESHPPWKASARRPVMATP